MNIYVSNLSFNVQDEDLKEFFAPYGEVSFSQNHQRQGNRKVPWFRVC